MNYVCPHCESDKSLWRGVTVGGWQSVGHDLQPGTGDGQEEIDGWHNAEPDGVYGCGECDWQGMKRDLVRLGVDGCRLPEIHPRQERLRVA